MNIQTIASSSSGNCFCVDSDGIKILLDAGVSFKKIQQALNFKVSELVGCLCTHEHL